MRSKILFKYMNVYNLHHEYQMKTMMVLKFDNLILLGISFIIIMVQIANLKVSEYKKMTFSVWIERLNES